jgi:hypothetical protein
MGNFPNLFVLDIVPPVFAYIGISGDLIFQFVLKPLGSRRRTELPSARSP